MSETTTSTTARVGDISSADSLRHSLDQTPTAGNSSNGTKLAFNHVPKKETSVLLEEPKVRRSSPESDAVASSDEEQDQTRLGSFAANKAGGLSQLSSRRPSYAAEFHTRQRTYSVTGGGPLSPTTSHPATPQGDTTVWAAGISASNASHGPGASLGPFWGGGSIWNSEPSRKSPPKQLNLPPTATGPAHPSPLFSGSEALPSPTSMPTNNSEFPIPIPLQPQFRNYRSMSFSVGQMEVDDQNRSRLSPPAMAGAMRQPPHSGLQHRPSRPSLLSEEQFPGPSSPLRIVNESEDDEDRARENLHPQNTNGYFPGQLASYSRAKYEAMRLRHRSASAATIPTLSLGGAGLAVAGMGSAGLDEYESAVAEEEDWDFAQFQAEQRRFSEVPRAMSLMYSPTENQRLENIRRHHWASQGGAFGPDAGTQSRRHSFAGGLPIADAPEAEFGLANSEFLAKRALALGENGAALGPRGNNYLSLTDVSNFEGSRKDGLYDEARLRSRQFPPGAAGGLGQSPATPSSQHHIQQMPSYAPPGRTSPPSVAHRSMLGMSMHPQPRGQQLLYFVTFKACRGDVFYVQEGTGLRVRTGDLVIVEADRGTDLGTVIAENISWAQAKELKEQYAKEQYNVLMMYASRRAAAPGAPAGPGTGNMNGSAAPSAGYANGSAGAMPGHGQPQGQDGVTAELKPKMIKRLAQPHEIQTLRDKEANEAKAKRVCQQKVLEHRLPMEILDAEFQMDWKKLTFYYFADSYINFNSLVTDLFKVYKTRIWMSAMNPASFAGAGSGIIPSTLNGLGSAGLGPIGEAPIDSLQPPYTGLGQSYPSYAASGGANGVLGSAQRAHNQPNAQQHASINGFPSRHSPPHFSSSQEYATSLVAPNEYGPTYANGVSAIQSQQGLFGEADGLGPSAASEAWLGGLQRLSLNSH